MTPGPDNPPLPSSAETPKADPTAAIESPLRDDVATAPSAEPNRFKTGASILGLVVLGGFVSAAVVPRLVQAIPALESVFPGGNAELVDELSAELAAQDNVLTAIKRRFEAQTSRVAALSDETAAQGTAIADLESRLGAVDEGGSSKTTGSPAARLEMLTLRIGQLESAFVPLSERASQAIESARSQKEVLAAQAQLSTALATLEGRLQALEQSAAGDRRGALIALSFAALREIANRGRPFAAEFEALTSLLADSNRSELAAELQGVAAYAPSGAPSLSGLRGSFDEAAAAILHAAAVPEGANWWQRAIAEFKSLVTIRPTGDVVGTAPDAIIARAEQRLNRNDLAGAVDELKTLQRPAAVAAAPWLRGAEARLAVDEAMARFANVLIHAVAVGEEPTADQPNSEAPNPSNNTGNGGTRGDSGSGVMSGSGA